MFNLQVIIISLCVLMFVFYILGRSSRRNSDEEKASLYYSIFFMALFAVIILLIVYFIMVYNLKGESSEEFESLLTPYSENWIEI